MRLTIAIENLVETMAKMTRAAEGLEDRKGLHEDLGTVLLKTAQARFKSGVAPDGTPWKQSLRARVQGGQTLVDTGNLRKSIHYTIDDQGLDLGTNVKYARIHQYGGVIRPKKAKALKFQLADGTWAVVKRVVMPARPYIGISAQDEENLVDTTIQYIKRFLKNG